MDVKPKKLVALASAALCAFALAGCSAGAGERTVVVNEGEAMPTITVTANSEVSVVPDKAQIGVAVTTQAATAEATQSRNAEDVNAVIEALAQLGIDEKSIQTTDTYLNPRYDYSTPVYGVATSDFATTEIAEAATPEADEGDSTNIVGYEMTSRLTIKDLDIDQVGEVLQACIEAGANNTDGIQYYSSEYDAKYAEALTAAVDDARAKAEVLAQAAGVTLGGVYSMTEGYQNTAYRYDSGVAMEAALASDSTMKVMPGEVDVTASVTVAYEIG